jgi:hypothetical protein
MVVVHHNIVTNNWQLAADIVMPLTEYRGITLTL